MPASDIVLREPTRTDGSKIFDLVAACPPLDGNSMYCNLLQATDFADTSVLAERGGEIVGWISGYRPPTDPGALFIWQVAVHEDARGVGLGGRMLDALLDRTRAKRVKTTITDDNEASWRLFRGFAKRHDAEIAAIAWFDRAEHFDDRHPSESMVTIGPLRA